MALPVVTVASGGLAVVDNTAATPPRGMAVSEAAAGSAGIKYGIAVTKVASGGLPVIYVSPPP